MRREVNVSAMRLHGIELALHAKRAMAPLRVPLLREDCDGQAP